MARKPFTSNPSPVRTEVRNSPLPRSNATTNTGTNPSSAGSKREVNREAIAKRAYEIWKSGKGGSQLENWLRAERELRGG